MTYKFGPVDLIFARRSAIATSHQVLAMEKVESSLYMNRSISVLIGWIRGVPKHSTDGLTTYFNLAEAPGDKSTFWCQCPGVVGRQLSENDFVMVVARPVAIKARTGKTAIQFICDLVIDLRTVR